MNRRWVALVVLPLLLLTAACGDDKPKSAAKPDEPGKTVTIGEDDNNSTQRLAVGELLEIELQTAGGSGYSWNVTTDPDSKVLAFEAQSQDRTEPTEADSPPLVGAPETVSTTFSAVGKGTTKVVLGHVPPAGGEAEETFTVNVIVE